MNTDQTSHPHPELRDDQLERHFISEYLKGKGHTWESLHNLPEEEAKHLLAEASLYASNKLAELETRAALVQEVRGTSQAP